MTETTSSVGLFTSVQDVRTKLAEQGYLPDDAIATAVFLADRLGKPLLVEGPAGVGKTELSKAIAAATHAELIRLQCYEGLDESRALYEWNYKKQLLRIQAAQAGGDTTWDEIHDDVFAEEFLLERPLLAAIRRTGPTVLLVDEIDKADVEVEGLLLEILSDFQVTIPELGTIVATRRPLVVLTSNAARELSEALKRRCLFLYLDYPDAERERRHPHGPRPGPDDLAERGDRPDGAGAPCSRPAQVALHRGERRLGADCARSRPHDAGRGGRQDDDGGRAEAPLGPGAGGEGAEAVSSPAASFESDGLPTRLIEFVRSLRDARLAVSTAEAIDASTAMVAIGLSDRDSLREALAVTLCKKPTTRATFDSLFDLYFPRRIGEGAGAQLDDPAADPKAQEAAAHMLDGDTAAARAALRDMLLELLMDGDEDALRRFAEQAVSILGKTQSLPGRQSWFAYRVMQGLSPQTLTAPLLERMLAGQEKGGLAEQVARTTIQERLRQLTEQIESEVRRRIAEEKGVETVARAGVKPLADQVDFLHASRAELAELRRTVIPLARRLATRLAAKQHRDDHGRLDFRRTVRGSMAYGGVPVNPVFRPKKPHKPELVLLCDVSSSVASFAHFTLLLAHSLREQFSKVRTFAFVDTLDEVSTYFEGMDGGDLGPVMARISAEANIVWLEGQSDYGHSFEVFAEKYPEAVTSRTSVLVLGDGRNNYRATAIDTVRQLAKEAKHFYWLNPEPRQYWYTGDSAIGAYESVVDEMVECRNSAQLSAFVARLLPA